MRTRRLLLLTSLVSRKANEFAALTSLALLFTGLFLGGASAQAQARVSGTLGNFDVRYPASLPNDLEIVLYGSGIAATDVNHIWNTDILLGAPPRGLQWGTAQPDPVVVNTDPTSPAFGLDCLTLRYAGPARPNLVGQMVHAGVALKPGVVPAHWEVWWTINGQRILRPCDPRVTWIWIRRTKEWIICIENPTPVPIYVYGCRWFLPPENSILPTLDQLTTAIDPAQFGGNWTIVDPVGTPAKCILPWCRIYIRVRITVVRCWPIIFQIAARNAPLENAPSQPNPDDWNGEQGTMFIMTSRATQEFDSDTDGDGVVGLPDFNMLRGDFGMQSQDMGETTPPTAAPPAPSAPSQKSMHKRNLK